MPNLRCLMLTSYADDEALFDAIMAGASGFVLKRVLGSDQLNAVRTVGSLLDPRTTTALLDRIRRDQHDPDLPARPATRCRGAGVGRGRLAV